MRTIALIAAAVLCSDVLSAPPQGGAIIVTPVQVTDPIDRQILDAYLAHVEKLSAYCTPERMAQFASQPEDIVWQGSQYIRVAYVAYLLTADPKYLDMFVERMDTLCDQLTTGPDGKRGWYGLAYDLFRHPDHPDRAVDVQITSFQIAGMLADFARVIQGDEALQPTYGAKVEEYLALAQELVDKWEARGSYRDLGVGGAVYTTHPDLHPVKGDLTQPQNKLSKLCRALIHLYAATGREDYLVKAIKLGTRFKHNMTLVDDHYEWNYLNPAGAWDINPDKPEAWKHWIGTEHRGAYYNLSVQFAVALYEHGLVFDAVDMQRFVNTQVNMCWNGDLASPAWRRVDGTPMEDQRYLAAWLAPFDERIYALAFEGPVRQERLERRDHAWQGGIVAMEWLEARYVLYPRWRGGEPAETQLVAGFLDKPENRALVDSLAFSVTGENSYVAPKTPAEMDPMPGAG